MAEQGDKTRTATRPQVAQPRGAVDADGATLRAESAVPPAAGARPGSGRALGGDSARFQLGTEHARGGLGRVVNAQDLELNREVVVKELLGSSEPDRQRFEREALITARLQHPSIVPIYSAGVRPSGEPFYAMKKVAGRSLREVIAGTSTLEERLALVPKVLAVIEAIAYAHDRKILHRDLKPANVMIGDYGETVVIDWGLAKDVSEPEPALDPEQATRGERTVSVATDSGAELTVQGEVLGTPAYMPPEQARGAKVDARADVYALGAILYHLLAGRCPYAGATLTQLLGPERPTLAPLQDIAPGVPAALAGIVERAMAVEKRERFATAGELAAELERYQDGQAVGVHVMASLRTTDLERHAWWKEAFTGLQGASAPLERLVLLAWVHLLVIFPLVYIPVALEGIRYQQKGVNFGVVDRAWPLGAALVLVANAVIVLRSRWGTPSMTLAWWLTVASLLGNISCNLISTYPIGIITSAAAFYLALIIAFYRIGLDHRLGLIATVGSVLGYLLAVILELSGAVAVHPALPDARLPHYEIDVSSWAVVIPTAGGLVLLFVITNYSVNQSLKLQRYITNSVLRRYLPPDLVERAARGELSQVKRRREPRG